MVDLEVLQLLKGTAKEESILEVAGDRSTKQCTLLEAEVVEVVLPLAEEAEEEVCLRRTYVGLEF